MICNGKFYLAISRFYFCKYQYHDHRHRRSMFRLIPVRSMIETIRMNNHRSYLNERQPVFYEWVGSTDNIIGKRVKLKA